MVVVVGGGGFLFFIYNLLFNNLLVFVDSVTTPRCGGVEDQTV